MTRNSFKIAVTGGIGSGKSVVLKIIADEGFSTFSCDGIYNGLLFDRNFLQSICKVFGDVLTDDGQLDRKKLSSIVFSDKDKLNQLNEITHPVIMAEALKRMSEKDISFCEVPLLFEGGYEKCFDAVIVVLRSLEQRISSVLKRDNITTNEVKKRIFSQLNYDNQQFIKYYVIYNNGNLSDLRAKTLKIIDKIIKK